MFFSLINILYYLIKLNDYLIIIIKNFFLYLIINEL